MRKLLLGLLLLVALGAALFVPGFLRSVSVGAGFVAKQMCSCVFVGGRSAASCRPDLPEEMDAIEVEPLDEGEGFRAFVSGLVERRALYEAPYGCTLQP